MRMKVRMNICERVETNPRVSRETSNKRFLSLRYIWYLIENLRGHLRQALSKKEFSRR